MKNIIVWRKIFIFVLLFFTFNKCFFSAFFNVKQLLSNITHFVLYSQAHLKIILKTKTFEKIYFIRSYWISNTKVRFTMSKFFLEWSLKIQKLISGDPNNREEGVGFFFRKKISGKGGGRGGGTFIWDLRILSLHS